MMIMRIFVVELLCEAVMGWIPALECLLPGTRGCMWLCLVLSGIKWPRYMRIPALGSLARYW
jgi:hypothetical protein